VESASTGSGMGSVVGMGVGVHWQTVHQTSKHSGAFIQAARLYITALILAVFVMFLHGMLETFSVRLRSSVSKNIFRRK
jgi:hypothetical protein